VSIFFRCHEILWLLFEQQNSKAPCFWNGRAFGCLCLRGYAPKRQISPTLTAKG